QIAHGLEILLDEFGAPWKQAHGALASRRRCPARETQRDAIRRLEGSGGDVLRHRVGGGGNEGHDTWREAGAPALYQGGGPPQSERGQARGARDEAAGTSGKTD